MNEVRHTLIAAKLTRASAKLRQLAKSLPERWSIQLAAQEVDGAIGLLGIKAGEREGVMKTDDEAFKQWYDREGWNWSSGHSDDARQIFQAGLDCARADYDAALRELVRVAVTADELRLMLVVSGGLQSGGPVSEQEPHASLNRRIAQVDAALERARTVLKQG